MTERAVHFVVVVDGVLAIDQNLKAKTATELFSKHELDLDLAEDSMVEEAVRLKKRIHGSALTLLAAAPAPFERHMRSYLAAGCDRAIRIDYDPVQLLDVALRAQAITEALRYLSPWRAAMMLDRTPGGAPAVLPHLVAQRLGLCSAASVTIADLRGDELLATGRRGGIIRRYRSTEPLILAMSSRVAPHSPSFMDVHRSRKAQIETFTLDPVVAAPATQVAAVREPKKPTSDSANVQTLTTQETIRCLAAICSPFRVRSHGA